MGSACEFLEWDSSFFGFRIATVTVAPTDTDGLGEVEAWCRTNRIDCLYCLIRASEWPSVHAFEEHRFRLVDVRVTLSWLPAHGTSEMPESHGPDCVVRPVDPSDVARLRELARVNHRISRFYNDPGFPTERCDALYETWIRKSCDEGYADAVLVAEFEGAAAGYVTCHLDDDRRGRIGLVGLAPDVRGKGFGSRLVRAAQRWFVEQEVSVVTVVGQGQNRAGQRMYQRCGFRTHDTSLWFHRWFPASPGSIGEA